MRSLLLLIVWASCAHAGERFVVTAPPRFETRTVERVRVCVKVRGIDTDIQSLEKECFRAWSWPGGTEEALRAHLREHGVTELEGVPLESLKKIHAAIHERELKAAPVQSSPAPATPAYVAPRCPGGVCPAPVQSVRRSRLRLFSW